MMTIFPGPRRFARLDARTAHSPPLRYWSVPVLPRPSPPDAPPRHPADDDWPLPLPTDDTYGPSACGTRLERFHRAQRLGLNPPPEVEVILDEALALAAEEERKGSRANPAKLRSARLMNRPFTAAPLDVDV